MLQAGVPTNLQWGTKYSLTTLSVEPNPTVTRRHCSLYFCVAVSIYFSGVVESCQVNK